MVTVIQKEKTTYSVLECQVVGKEPAALKKGRNRWIVVSMHSKGRESREKKLPDTALKNVIKS